MFQNLLVFHLCLSMMLTPLVSVSAHADPAKSAREGAQLLKGVQSPTGAAVYSTGEVVGGMRKVYYMAPGPGTALQYGWLSNQGKVNWIQQTPVVTDGKTINHEVKAMRPSALPAVWTPQVEANARRGFELIVRGELPNPNEKIFELVGNSNPLSELAGAAGTFYFALGMVAAYELWQEYPDNPMAFERYMENLTPVKMAMLTGFFFAARAFMKGTSLGSGKSFIRSLPMYAAGLVAGQLTASMIEWSLDIDVWKCTGVRAKIHGFPQDLEACDRAYAKYNAEDYSLQFFPPLANLVSAGLLAYSTYYLIQFTAFAKWFAKVPIFGRNPVSAAVKGVAGLIVFFSIEKYVIRNYFELDRYVRNLMLEPRVLDAENKLFADWQRVKSANWADTRIAATPVDCTARAIPGRPPYELQKSPECLAYENRMMNFEETLQNYGANQDLWRSQQMKPTFKAFKDWSEKVQRYHDHLNAATNMYRELLARIDFDRRNPGAGDTDPRGFNPTALQAFYESLKQQEGFVDPVFFEEPESRWQSLRTSNYISHIVASMACGPVAGQSGVETGALASAKNFVTKWAYRATEPLSIVEKRAGRALVFNPPRIVRETGASVCNSSQASAGVRGKVSGTSAQWAPSEFPVIPSMLSGGKHYPDLYAYIKDNLSSGLIVDHQSRFEDWWFETIMPEVMATEEEIRAEYNQMLNTAYAQALLDNRYDTCEERADADKLSFAKYLNKAPSFTYSSCGSYKTRRLARGVLSSYRDELNLYVSMLTDIYVSMRPKQGLPARITPAVYEQQFSKATSELLQAYDEFAASMADTQSFSIGKAQVSFAVVAAKWQNVNTLITDRVGTEYSPRQHVSNALMSRVSALLNQTNAYFIILIGPTFPVFSVNEGPPVQSELKIQQTNPSNNHDNGERK